MFSERYYESFTVRVKIIAYNAIIIFRHPVEFAIFAVSNFFSLFCIAIFYVKSSHNYLFFDYDTKIQPFFVITNFF